MGKRFFLAALVGAAVLGSSGQQLRADSINIASSSLSTEGLGSFTGSIHYAPNSFDYSPADFANGFGGMADLKIVLKNTSGAGAITAFGFNVLDPDGESLAVTYLQRVGDTFRQDLGVNAEPFGTFEIGTITGPNFNGGNVADGIADGEERTFLFEVAPEHVDISAMTFLTGANPFAVRFQGLPGAGSDKVIAELQLEEPPSAPLPAAVWGGLALFGVLGLSRKGKEILR